MSTPILKACVETLEEAVAAEKLGADRLELCSALEYDGLTPSFELTNEVLKAVSIPVKVMIRSRKGDFEYSATDMQQMRAELLALSRLQIDGVVFGALKDRKLDLDLISQIAAAAGEIPLTVHKCIDQTTDPVEGVKELLSVPNVKSILTSGGASTALEGKETLIAMQRAAGSRITIIAAGRITAENFYQVSSAIGAKEYHGRRIVGNLVPDQTPWDSTSHNQ